MFIGHEFYHYLHCNYIMQSTLCSKLMHEIIIIIPLVCFYLDSGINSILVNLMAQKGEVKYDPAYLMPSQIANKISELGYPAEEIEMETAGQGTIELAVCLNFVRSSPEKASENDCILLSERNTFHQLHR